ncbi:hypothetical protein [Arthrobacter sp. CP30]
MTRLLGPADPGDGSLLIRGGVGGIRFQWEELDHAASVLSLLASDTAAVATALAQLDAEVAELPWRQVQLLPPGVGAGAIYEEARGQVGASLYSTMGGAASLAGTAGRLRSAVDAYAWADDAARAATESARRASVVTARALAREAIHRGALDVGPIDLLEAPGGVSGTASDIVAFDGSIEGVVARISAVEAEGPGVFEVLRLGTQMQPVHLVVLPGTQSGLVGDARGSNPFDAGGVAEALAVDSRHTEAAVREALRRAGAQAGDALILAGYSQGGIHAVNLAREAGLGASYDVQLVVTVGSPTGWHTTADTEYLHLEHAVDPVPLLDAIPNPDDPHRTTITLTHQVPPLGREADGSVEPWGLGPAHKLGNYAAGARLVDASTAPSLGPATSLLASAATRGSARRSSFTAVRRPDPLPGPPDR